MRRHVLHQCKLAPTKNTVARLQKEVKKTKEVSKRAEEQCVELKKEVEELRAAVASPPNYIAITLILNNFSEEDTDHLTEPEVRAILNSCVDKDPEPTPAHAAKDIVAALGRAIYANPEREENHTACLLSRKADRGCIFREGEWRVGSAIALQQSMAGQIVKFYLAQTFASWRKFEEVTRYFQASRDSAPWEVLRDVLLETGKILQKRDPRMMKDLIQKFRSSLAQAAAAATATESAAESAEVTTAD